MPVPDAPKSVMAAQSGDVRLQVVFGRAFLLELERGNLENAKVFARAFLRQAPLATRNLPDVNGDPQG